MGRRRAGTAVGVVVAGVVLLGVLAAALVRDGGTGSADGSTAGSAAAPSRVVAPGDVAVPGAGGAGSAGRAAEAGADIAFPAGPVPPGGPVDPDLDPGTDPLPDAVGRDVVRTAQLTVEVADPAAAARSVRTAAAAAGGLVAQEQADTTGSWLVLRVPSAGLDRLVDDLAALGSVLARAAHAEDATAQVVDLDSRVATQRASVTRVRALLAQAASVGDVVAVESELARREADLESLERRLAALRGRVALSTLTVELRGAAAPPPAAAPPGFGSGLGAGWAGLRAVGTALATAAGFLLPFLPLLAAAGVVVWVVRRRRRRRGGPGSEGGV